MDNKIYITNFWHTRDNYGANLTAFALQEVLQQLGFENKLVNNPIFANEIKLKKFFGFKFQQQHLKTTQKIDQNADVLNSDCEIFITGSDQVFRPIFTQGMPEQYWLDFVKPDKKKIAFSASFGVDKEQFLKENSQEIIEHMKNSLNSFDFISVREKSGVEICKDLFDVDAEWIIDPVFILDKSRYDDLIQSATEDYSNKIVSYILDINKEYKKAYKYLSEQYQVNVVEVANSNESAENWLKAIRDCKILITDSFHGMCFAIIFNKPFICLANKQRGATRFESVLEMLSIDYQCIDNTQEIYEKDCIFKVDYDVVNKRIKEERQRGLDYLKMALEAPVQVTQEKINARINFLEHKVCELEQQATLKYQIRKELWKLWLVIFHKYLPKPIKNIIRAVREKLCKIGRAHV